LPQPLPEPAPVARQCCGDLLFDVGRKHEANAEVSRDWAAATAATTGNRSQRGSTVIEEARAPLPPILHNGGGEKGVRVLSAGAKSSRP
jgi:hypothetical protein